MGSSVSLLAQECSMAVLYLSVSKKGRRFPAYPAWPRGIKASELL